MGTLKGVDTDYDKLYRWCTAHGWLPRIHHAGAHQDTWHCQHRLGQAHNKPLVVVGDVSEKTGSTIWGLGAVVADTQGNILWQGQATMDVLHGSTNVLETTAVMEACRALVAALQAHGDTIDLVHVFCDNQGAAKALAHRKLTQKGGSLLDRVVVISMT